MSQTLFLQDSKSMIRLESGEYEVSNPEMIASNNLYFRDGYPELEWPGDIEKVCACECQIKPMFCFVSCGKDKTIKVKLLPKKPVFIVSPSKLISHIRKHFTITRNRK